MTRPEVLRRRLAHLEAYLRVLRGLARYTPEEIDWRRVYGVLQENLEDLEALSRVFAHFL